MTDPHEQAKPGLLAFLKRSLLKLLEWSIPSFVLALMVGFILQHADNVATIGEEAVQLGNRAAYSVRPVWDTQIEWSDERRADIFESMDALHFGLEGRLPEPLWVCAGGLMNMAKTAPNRIIFDVEAWAENFQAHRTAYNSAIREWRLSEGFFPWWPFEKEISCTP